MDWYIFLTPLLLLPIIFLYRLIGCGLDETGHLYTTIVTLDHEGIPTIPGNPILQFTVSFEVKPFVIFMGTEVGTDKKHIYSPQEGLQVALVGSDIGTFTFTAHVSEPASDGIWCQCHGHPKRAFDENFLDVKLGPPFKTLKPTLNLHLRINESDPPTTDYLPNNFEVIEVTS
jgi:hypothetical protein